MTLIDCPHRKKVKILNINLESEDKARLWELGISENAAVEVVRFFAKTTALIVCEGAVIAIGREYAEKITVSICE